MQIFFMPLLELFDMGNIMMQAKHASGMALFITNRHAVRMDPHRGTVAVFATEHLIVGAQRVGAMLFQVGRRQFKIFWEDVGLPFFAKMIGFIDTVTQSRPAFRAHPAVIGLV